MVPPHRVANKGQRLAPNNFQKLVRVKNRQITPIGPPLPLHELGVGSTIFHAILMFMDRPTRRVRVIRSIRISDPLPCKNVTIFIFSNLDQVRVGVVGGRGERRGFRDRRRVVEQRVVERDYSEEEKC